MTTIEEKSMAAQLSLTNDILANYQHICYSVTERSKKIIEHLSTQKYNNADKTVSLEKEVFDTIMKGMYILADERKWKQLGILAESAVPANEVKLKVLRLLQ